jgi:predicted RNA-binding protein YlxR (DUF448 family)
VPTEPSQASRPTQRREKKPHRGSAAAVPADPGARDRTCAVTRETHPAEHLIRVFAGPEGRAVVDARGRKGGRGAWLLPRKDVLERAESTPALLRRALREEGLVVEGLLEAARAQVRQQILDLLSLAARAGALASGGDSVEGALRAGSAAIVLVASDASEGTVARVSQLAPTVPRHAIGLDKGDLGERIGKGPRAIVVVRPCSLAKALLRELRKGDSLR